MKYDDYLQGCGQVVGGLELDRALTTITTNLAGNSGVTSRNSKLGVVRRAIQNGDGSSVAIAESIASVAQVLAREAKAVGLKINVDDLARFVRILASRHQMYIDGNAPFLPPLYKGVSYNPSGDGLEEWILLLDFFALLRRLCARAVDVVMPPQFAILDASPYWVINLLGEKGINLTSLTCQGAAEELVSFLNAQFKQRLPVASVYDIALGRNGYLRALAEQFPARCMPVVFSVCDIFNDSNFVPFLAKTIEGCCGYEAGRWVVRQAVNYNRYMTYSPWVTPIVAAEHTFLASQCGFRLTLAPVQEAAWNQAVDSASRIAGTPCYGAIMYTRPNTGDLAYRDYPFFSDTAEVIEQKLRNNSQLVPVAAALVRPFLDEERSSKLDAWVTNFQFNSLAEAIASFTGKVHTRAKELMIGGTEPSPIAGINWLMSFPRGTC